MRMENYILFYTYPTFLEAFLTWELNSMMKDSFMHVKSNLGITLISIKFRNS